MAYAVRSTIVIHHNDCFDKSTFTNYVVTSASPQRGNEYPEILCGVTAHAAFDKAAAMLGMTIRHVPVDKVFNTINSDYGINVSPARRA